VQNAGQTSSHAPIMEPEPSDMVSRLSALDPFFEDDTSDGQDAARGSTPYSHAAAGNRISRRMSMTLRGLLNPQLRIPRNRHGIYLPQSPFTCDFPDSPNPASIAAQSADRLSLSDPPVSFPPPASVDHNLRFTPQLPFALEDSITDNLDDSRRRARPRPIYVDEVDERRARRATWGPGQAVIPNLDSNVPTILSERPGTPSVSRPASQYLPVAPSPLSSQSLAASSPLTSISSLFSRNNSNTSSPTTISPPPREESGASAVLRAGAARLATRTGTDPTDSGAEESSFDQMRARNMRRLGRLSRARSRLRRELDSLRSRSEDDNVDISEIHRIIRGLGRPGTRGGAASDEEERTDGMAPFTIVGIRRVGSREGMEDDFLPPYLRDLVVETTPPPGMAESVADGSRHEQRQTSRQRRQRRVLSFYDRMEFQSREAVGRLQRSRPRSMYGSGSRRRNGVVEPDSPTDDEGAMPRHETYVIYLISGVLPENHPLLATPSLFTENPSYEDMLLIASLLGPAKPPVAAPTDVDAAPGLFRIEVDAVVDGRDKLVAVSRETDERIPLPPVMEDGAERPERCLICLSDFEAEDEARKLVKCGHLFHKDCIGHVSHFQYHFWPYTNSV
jgi:hypothetical protein